MCCRGIVYFVELYGKAHIIGLPYKGDADQRGPCAKFAAVHQNRFPFWGNVVGVPLNDLPIVGAGIDHCGSLAILRGVRQCLIIEAKAHACKRVAGDSVHRRQLHIRTHGNIAGVRAGEAQDVGHRVYHLIHAGDLGIYIVGSDLQLAAKVAVFGVDRANIGFRVKGAAAVDNDIGRRDGRRRIGRYLQCEIFKARSRDHGAIMADEASKRAVAAPDGIIDGHVAEDRRLSAGEGGIVVPIEGKRARADLQLQIPGASRGVCGLGLLLDERYAGKTGELGRSEGGYADIGELIVAYIALPKQDRISVERGPIRGSVEHEAAALQGVPVGIALGQVERKRAVIAVLGWPEQQGSERVGGMA